MRYVLRDGLFGPGAPFEIPNQHGWRLLSAVPGEPWEDALAIRDRAGIERATIMRFQLPAGLVHYISRADTTLAVVTREAGLLRSTIVVRFADGGEARVRGEAAAGEFRIVQGGQALAEASRRGFAHADRVAVDVPDGHNDALLLAVCIAVQDLAREQGATGLRGWLRRAA